MSLERVTAGTGLGAELASPQPAADDSSGGISPSLRMQILSTEHWSLLASRSLAWNESFSRAGMYLSTLSGAIVALALVAQATNFGEGFLLFALVLLPVVLFVGVTTVIRLGASNYHDAMCVVGMNRIRAGYLQLAPELEPFFVMSAHDDIRGMSVSMGMEPGVNSAVHGLAATPAVISVINAVVVASIASLVAVRLGSESPLTVVVGIAAFVVAMALHGYYGRRVQLRGEAGLRPLFPAPDGDQRSAR